MTFKVPTASDVPLFLEFYNRGSKAMAPIASTTQYNDYDFASTSTPAKRSNPKRIGSASRTEGSSHATSKKRGIISTPRGPRTKQKTLVPIPSFSPLAVKETTNTDSVKGKMKGKESEVMKRERVKRGSPSGAKTQGPEIPAWQLANLARDVLFKEDRKGLMRLQTAWSGRSVQVKSNGSETKEEYAMYKSIEKSLSAYFLSNEVAVIVSALVNPGHSRMKENFKGDHTIVQEAGKAENGDVSIAKQTNTGMFQR